METGIGLQQPAPSLECSQHYFGLRAISPISADQESNESSRVLLKSTRNDELSVGDCWKCVSSNSFTVYLSDVATADFELPGCPVMTMCWLGVLNQFWLDQRPDALRTIQGAQISPGLPTSLTSPICYLRHKIGVKFLAGGENSSKTWNVFSLLQPSLILVLQNVIDVFESVHCSALNFMLIRPFIFTAQREGGPCLV